MRCDNPKGRGYQEKRLIGLCLANNNVAISTLDNRFQLRLFGGGNLEIAIRGQVRS